MIMLVVAILLRLIGVLILSFFFSLLSSTFSENSDRFYFFFIFWSVMMALNILEFSRSVRSLKSLNVDKISLSTSLTFITVW